jgi:hypothetical protein
MAGHRTKILEKDIEKSILQFLDMHPNVFVWKQNTTGMYDPKTKRFRALRGFCKVGISDILMVTSPDGRFGAIEVKTPERAKAMTRLHGFPCTPEQNYFIQRVKTNGGFAGVATSLEEAIEICRGNF